MNTLAVLSLLAQLFRQPLDVPTRAISLFWALPICLSISLIYKAVKLDSFKPALYFREVLFLFATIIGFLIAVAVILLLLSQLVR